MTSIQKPNQSSSAEPILNWDSIETVLLDMDGTILDLRFDNYFWLELLPKVYAEQQSVTIDQAKQFLKDSYGAIEGKLQWYCLDFWSARLEIDIPKLKESVKEHVAFRPGAIEFLKFLKTHNKQVILATNAHRKSLEIKMLNVDFHQYFDELTSSHDFGFPKEEQAYWHALNKKIPFDKQTTLFVDDSVRILGAAKKFGIAHVLGIAQPDSHKPKQACTPFEAIDDFRRFIGHD